MNILPLVSALLIILALLSATLAKENRATHFEEKNYRGYMGAQRGLKNKIEVGYFTNAPEEKTSSETTSPAKEPKSHTKQNSSVSRRDKRDFSELAKFNLALLLAETPHQYHALFYETAARLIKQLYGHAPFFAEQDPYQILDCFIEQARLHPDITSFAKLQPFTPETQDSFYKMIKGTNKYDTLRKKGYPPLDDFMRIDRKCKERPFNFCYAPRPLLSALVGEAFAQEIIEKERVRAEEKKAAGKGGSRTLLKEDFGKMVHAQESHLLFKEHDIDALFSFGNKASPKKHQLSTDPTSGISTKSPI